MNKNEINFRPPREAYYDMSYNKLHRFILYYYQIFHVVKTKPQNVLDIGVGAKTVSDELKKMGLDVVTCDIDPNLNPDVVADIKNLSFKENEFDTVMACEVLEHLPFSDFEASLKELKRVAKNNVIISIPYFSGFTQLRFRMSLNILKLNIDRDMGAVLRLPYFFKKVDINKNKKHYWEMGAKYYSKRKIRKIVNKYFKIKKEFYVPLSPKHYFFILESD
ncbi:class I SAM-dependent methyltransferase [Candidatus Parcubacteria bacterium]|nr:class I SAM-dependent methyltransferase [Candidatus Parcubacteria bacterium]